MTRLNIKWILFSGAFILTSSYATAQTTSDALRFSQTINGGTARFTSMGGAFGALGADFTSLSINPAGLGVYKSSEFTITPSFKHNSIKSAYNETNASDTKNRLSFDNVGLVLSFNPYKTDERGIVNYNIGFGYNRTNDFNANSYSKGNNNVNSIMDYFAEKASGYYYEDLFDDDNKTPFKNGVAPWDVIMAWNTYLLFDTIAGTNGTEYMPALLTGDGVVQKNIVNSKGGSGVYDISFAINISNKLFIGASLGISEFNYTYNATYKEDAFESNPELSLGNRFYYMDYNQYYENSGTGYNFKIGGIYTPISNIRIGLSIHTPTFYSFSEKYSYSMLSNFDINGTETNSISKSPLGRYEYDFETPFKLIGSFAYIFKNVGLISLDVEHLDYSSMKFRNGGDGYSFTNENSAIENTCKSVTNIRVGGEIKIKDFAIRAGYAFYPSPYKSGYLNESSNTSQISGGFGYRSGGFSIDMAYLHTIKKEQYLFYDYNGLNPVETKMNDGKVLVTLGFRF
ncbi:hemin receptor [Tenuifilaceae bacterium CYCD]|nr:hemin receptor [Tenuifilaceae bacterium CYCD]